MNVMYAFSVDFPVSVDWIFVISGVFMMDTSVLALECAFGRELPVLLLQSLLLPPVILIGFLLGLAVSNLVIERLRPHGVKLKMNNAINCTGMVWCALYVMMCKATFSYIECK